MDIIKIGLDFGTHQTKICVQRVPDEGHGEPNYEFFTFNDLKGQNYYFLPSVVQINSDNTLSYGYVDKKRILKKGPKPQLEKIEVASDFAISDVAEDLYNKYASKDNVPEDKAVLTEMLQIRKEMLKKVEEEKRKEALERYQSLLESYEQATYLFRYFKQATFINGEWDKSIPSKKICVWYLAYIIFLLEEEFGTNFSINMGVPADDNSFQDKQQLAVEILASAYILVEDVFHNDQEAFLRSTLDELNAKTEFINYSPQIKDDYNISIFPEAYASLIGLTSRGKLSDGMCLTVDAGGGTTDISFFVIQGDRPDRPVIYKYWSIPRGLNYIAEKSGFDYAEGHFRQKADEVVIEKYNRKKWEIVGLLINNLFKIRKDKGIFKSSLNAHLKDRIIVYSGGGSTYDFLNTAIHSFTDLKVIDASIWREENIKDKTKVSKLSGLLTTAYGLSVCKDDKEVQLEPFDTLFSHISGSGYRGTKEIDKDVC